jgi:hypothetical protein
MSPEFRGLFSDSELAVCRRPLAAYEWTHYQPRRPPGA